MNQTKIIFFDIDGTLIEINKGSVSAKTLEALIRLKHNGIKICIATGRSPMLVPQIPGIGFDAFLTYNGSYCFDGDQAIFSNSLKREDVLSIIENAKSIGRPLSLATKNRLAANGADQDLIDYYGFGGLQVQIADDFDNVAQNEEIYQIMMGCRKAEYDTVMRHVKDAKITTWWDRAIDIIPADSGKGTAVAKVIDYFHLTKEEAMAFGDGNNDIEMLQAVGHGVAMQNGSSELKAIADAVCDDVANDGIYSYCKFCGII